MLISTAILIIVCIIVVIKYPVVIPAIMAAIILNEYQPSVRGGAGVQHISPDVYKLETADTEYRMERLDTDSDKRDMWMGIASDDYDIIRRDQGDYFNDKMHTSYGTPSINMRAVGPDHTAGVTSFIMMLKRVGELWVASRWRKIDGQGPILECYVTVTTCEKSPVVTHNGITRSFKGMKTHISLKMRIRSNVAIPTHAFAAQVMKIRSGNTKQYMITSPVNAMSEIMMRAFPDKVYGPGIHRVNPNRNDNIEISSLQIESAQYVERLAKLEMDQTYKFWKRYDSKYMLWNTNLLIRKTVAFKWQTKCADIVSEYQINSMDEFMDYYAVNKATYITEKAEIDELIYKNTQTKRVLECWSPVKYTALKHGLVTDVWNIEETECILEYRDGKVFTNLDRDGSPESEYSWLRNPDAGLNPSRAILINDLASVQL